MQLPALHIGELTARVPIVQGGMGIGVSLSGLAGAVAREGGVGVISAAQVGFNEPDFMTNTVEANKRALAKQLKKAREIAGDGIIGVNIMWRGQHYEDYARCAVENGANIISPVLAFHLTFRTALKALPPKSHRLSVPRRQHASFSVFGKDIITAQPI